MILANKGEGGRIEGLQSPKGGHVHLVPPREAVATATFVSKYGRGSLEKREKFFVPHRDGCLKGHAFLVTFRQGSSLALY